MGLSCWCSQTSRAEMHLSCKLLKFRQNSRQSTKHVTVNNRYRVLNQLQKRGTLTLKHQYLKLVGLYDALSYVLLQFTQHSQHGYIGLAGTSRSTNQKVLVWIVCCVKDNRLDQIQFLCTLERRLSNLRHHRRQQHINDTDLTFDKLSPYFVEKEEWSVILCVKERMLIAKYLHSNVTYTSFCRTYF